MASSDLFSGAHDWDGNGEASMRAFDEVELPELRMFPDWFCSPERQHLLGRPNHLGIGSGPGSTAVISIRSEPIYDRLASNFEFIQGGFAQVASSATLTTCSEVLE
jgi:hypothetical protein